MLLATIIAAFALPKAKYTSPDVLSSIQIPFFFEAWRGRDVAKQLNLEDERFKFISRVLAREYFDPQGKNLLLLILDAGNFHHPKACFTGSGFTLRELPDTPITAAGRTIYAKTLFAQRKDEGFVILYWMVINQEVVDWNRQKLAQLWYSLIGRERVGLMIRLDIPTNEAEIPQALERARSFIASASSQLGGAQNAYLFGGS